MGRRAAEREHPLAGAARRRLRRLAADGPTGDRATWTRAARRCDPNTVRGRAPAVATAHRLAVRACGGNRHAGGSALPRRPLRPRRGPEARADTRAGLRPTGGHTQSRGLRRLACGGERQPIASLCPRAPVRRLRSARRLVDTVEQRPDGGAHQPAQAAQTRDVRPSVTGVAQAPRTWRSVVGVDLAGATRSFTKNGEEPNLEK